MDRTSETTDRRVTDAKRREIEPQDDAEDAASAREKSEGGEDGGGGERDAKTQWALDRTDWAEDRTVLANERTFAGWMRTGMAAIAIAVGLKAVFREADPTWLPKTVSTVFVAASLVIFFSAWKNAKAGQKRLDTHDTEEQDSRTFAVLSTVFSIGAVAVAGILWTL